MGDAFSIYGSGRYRRGGDFNLVFETGFGRLRGVPLLRDVLGTINRQLVAINVTGTPLSFKAQVEVVPPVTGAFSRLIAGALGGRPDQPPDDGDGDSGQP